MEAETTRKNREHRRESYAIANSLCSMRGLRATKREFTSLRGNAVCSEEERWLVIRSSQNPKLLREDGRGSQWMAKGTLHDVIRDIASIERALTGQATAENTAENSIPELPPEATTIPPENTAEVAGSLAVPDELRVHEIARAEAKKLDNEVRSALGAIVQDGMSSLRGFIPLEVNKAVQAELDARNVVQRVEIVVKLPENRDIECAGEHTLYPSILRRLALGINVFISGPAGSGKTTCAEHAAKAAGLEPFIVTPPNDPTDIFGYTFGKRYISSVVWRALTCERPACLILDEIDSSDPKALCALNGVLAGNKLAAFPHAQIPIPSTLRILATANTWGLGATATYVGRSKLDGATLNRFPSKIFFDYDIELERKLAIAKGASGEIVDLSLRIRTKLRALGIKLDWTPRDTFALGRLVASGLPLEEALATSTLAVLDDAKRAQVTGVS